MLAPPIDPALEERPCTAVEAVRSRRRSARPGFGRNQRRADAGPSSFDRSELHGLERGPENASHKSRPQRCPKRHRQSRARLAPLVGVEEHRDRTLYLLQRLGAVAPRHRGTPQATVTPRRLDGCKPRNKKRLCPGCVQRRRRRRCESLRAHAFQGQHRAQPWTRRRESNPQRNRI